MRSQFSEQVNNQNIDLYSIFGDQIVNHQLMNYNTTYSEWMVSDESDHIIDKELGPFSIFNPNQVELRNLTDYDAKTALGIHGKGLICLVRDMLKYERIKFAMVINTLNKLFPTNIDIERDIDSVFFQEFDQLTITDSSFQQKHGLRSMSESYLKALFYLFLVSSSKTPNVIGIDNLDSHFDLNMTLKMYSHIYELAKGCNKQVIITDRSTPLNLIKCPFDGYDVFRNKSGMTDVNFDFRNSEAKFV